MHMSLRTRDTRQRAKLLMDAFTEALLGIFALRIPPVQDAVRFSMPGVTVKSSYEGEHLNIATERLIDEIRTSGPEIKTVVGQVTAAFVASMWDLLKTHAHYDVIANKPEVQFFRHLRNACGHDGKWNFIELKHPAIWRDKELTLEHIGQEVFDGLLIHGDVVLLFIDIDLKYFEQPQ